MSGLRLEWRDSPRLWKHFPLAALPQCNHKGEVFDASGQFLCSFKAIKNLGEGTFSFVDAFYRTDASGARMAVALKRPKCPEVNLLYEALFQWKLSSELKEYGLGYTVPEVYDIFIEKQTDRVWFTMEYFKPVLVSNWCVNQLKIPEHQHYFILLLLQIALVLEVYDTALRIDHKDLKLDNLMILEKPVTVDVTWKGESKTLTFPFRVIFIDFGFACKEYMIDLKWEEIPPLDPCPKEGRNIFQVLVSLWNIQPLRSSLERSWGQWIRERISSVVPAYPTLRMTESTKDLDWMYTITDDREFRAPLCAPKRVIGDCMKALERQ